MKPDSDHVEISLPVDEMMFEGVVVLDVVDAFANFVRVWKRIFLDLESSWITTALRFFAEMKSRAVL